MSLVVDVVAFNRRMGPENTQVEVTWLFRADPRFLTGINVINWGDGFPGYVAPPNASAAYAETRTYGAPADQDDGQFGVATFAASLSGQLGFPLIANVAVSLTPDAEEGIFRVMVPIGLDSLVVGGLGDDTLIGGNLEDTIYAGLGDDTVLGGLKNDRLFGERGDDTLWGEGGADELIGNSGDDSLKGGHGNDTLSGNDDADTLDGGSGKDLLFGGTANDRLIAGSGDDTVFGDAGLDTIFGGVGSDMIVGGDGADRLITLADGARDYFVYNALSEGGDRIIGFVNGEDVIQVEFAAPGPLLVGTAPKADLPIGTYLFNTATSRFSYDPDGTGAAAPVVIATLVGVTTFSGDDLFFTL